MVVACLYVCVFNSSSIRGFELACVALSTFVQPGIEFINITYLYDNKTYIHT